jgi:hypothetical protein
VQHALTRSAARAATDDHDVADHTCPLALDTNEPWTEVEDQVIALAVSERPEDSNSELGCDARDREFGSSALLVSRQHDLQDSLRLGQRYAVAASSSTEGTSLQRSSRR